MQAKNLPCQQVNIPQNLELSNSEVPCPHLTIVTVPASELMQRLKSGFFRNMKPSIYNPACNTIKQIALI